jgi:osmotically-inducible protein OsmY
MTTNKDLKNEVLAELDYEPQVRAEHIGVTTENGVVTLYGHVKSFTERMAAEDCVRRIRGVRGIANEMSVNLPADPVITDDELALRAARMLDWHPQIAADKITLRVQDGRLDLDGDVSSLAEKLVAEKCVSRLEGLKSVHNHLKVAPVTPTSNLRERITAALDRQAHHDADRVHIEVTGQDVKITGEVGSFAERDLVGAVAARAPGVRRVENHLSVGD